MLYDDSEGDVLKRKEHQKRAGGQGDDGKEDENDQVDIFKTNKHIPYFVWSRKGVMLIIIKQFTT